MQKYSGLVSNENIEIQDKELIKPELFPSKIEILSENLKEWNCAYLNSSADKVDELKLQIDIKWEQEIKRTFETIGHRIWSKDVDAIPSSHISQFANTLIDGDHIFDFYTPPKQRIAYLHTALSAALLANDPIQCRLFYDLGYAYREISCFQLAQKYFALCRKAAQKAGIWETPLFAACQIALNHHSDGSLLNIVNDNRSFEERIFGVDESQRLRNRATLMRYDAESHVAKGQYKKAIDLCERAKELTDELGAERVTAHIQCAWGQALVGLHDDNGAANKLDNSFVYADNIDDMSLKANSAYALAKLYLKKGDKDTTKNYLRSLKNASFASGDNVKFRYATRIIKAIS